MGQTAAPSTIYSKIRCHSSQCTDIIDNALLSEAVETIEPNRAKGTQHDRHSDIKFRNVINGTHILRHDS